MSGNEKAQGGMELNKDGFDGTVEVWDHDIYGEACSDSPRQPDHRFLSMIEVSGEDANGRMTILREDNGGGSCMPVTRHLEWKREPSLISLTIQEYHICTRAKVKTTAVILRSGVVVMMEKKLNDETNLSKKNMGRKSDVLNGGRGLPSLVVGRRSSLEDNFQMNVVSYLRETRLTDAG
ncbi:hypothetical protein VNO80_30307 [Phaseolus coccineus]|uniref:Uncharacterized protein n=1 Tax=Phaseolus coccineus TaxID=3886 RepID=A0AAN9LFT4_PHACN